MKIDIITHHVIDPYHELSGVDLVIKSKKSASHNYRCTLPELLEALESAKKIARSNYSNFEEMTCKLSKFITMTLGAYVKPYVKYHMDEVIHSFENKAAVVTQLEKLVAVMQDYMAVRDSMVESAQSVMIPKYLDDRPAIEDDEDDEDDDDSC